METDIRAHLDAKRFSEAFEMLVDRYQHKAFRLSYSYMKNETQAEDMAQEAFMKVWNALPRYTGEASLSTWIYTITRNTCLDALRKKKRQNSLSYDDPDVAAVAERSHATHTHPTIGLDIETMLSRLDEKYRQVILMYYLEEKSYEDTAEALGLPLGTVKTYLHRAKKELAQMNESDSKRSLNVKNVKEAPYGLLAI